LTPERYEGFCGRGDGVRGNDDSELDELELIDGDASANSPKKSGGKKCAQECPVGISFTANQETKQKKKPTKIVGILSDTMSTEKYLANFKKKKEMAQKVIF
jgi:hypothetical protein